MPFTFAHGAEDWIADIADRRLRREVEARLRRQASRHAVPVELPLIGHFVAENRWIVAGRKAGEEVVRGDVLSFERRAELACDPYEALISSGLSWLSAFRPTAPAPGPPAARLKACSPDYLPRAWAWWLHLGVEERKRDYWSIVPAGTVGDAWPHARFTLASGKAGSDLAPATPVREPAPDRLSELESRLEGMLGSLPTLLQSADDQVSSTHLSRDLQHLVEKVEELRSKLDRVESSAEQGLPELRSQLDRVTCSLEQGLPELRSQLGDIADGMERRRRDERGAGTWILTAAVVAGLLGFGAGWFAGKGTPDSQFRAGISDELASIGNQLTALQTSFSNSAAERKTISTRLDQEAGSRAQALVDVNRKLELVQAALEKIETSSSQSASRKRQRRKQQREDGGDPPLASSGTDSEGEGEMAGGEAGER